MKVLRLAVFITIEVVLLPISFVGLALYMTIMLRCRRGGISYTAYEPLGSRVIFDALGLRPDPAAKAVLHALPTSTSLGITLCFEPTVFALRLSGFRPGFATLPVELPSTIMTMFTHRTEFFDRRLEAALAEVTQIVILGAGWDTRAYGMLRNRAARVFEVDAPATQDAKRVAVEKAGLDASSVTFVAVDFNTESWLERLQAEGFDIAEPAFVLWEGVTYYLQPAAAADTLAAVARLAPGSQVGFDYFSQELAEGRGPKQLARAHGWLRWLGEPWIFGIPTTPPPPRTHAEAFVESAGLRLEEHEPFGPDHEVFGGVVLASVPSS